MFTSSLQPATVKERGSIAGTRRSYGTELLSVDSLQLCYLISMENSQHTDKIYIVNDLNP